MQTEKCRVVSRILVIATALLMILPASVFLSIKSGMIVENDFSEAADSSARIPITGSRGSTPLGPIDTISKTVEIPAGKQYYVYYDNATNTLKDMQLPDYSAGLTQKALDALAKTPDWLDDDLAKRFGWLADINIDAGDRSTPTFADVDNDGDLDLIIGECIGKLKYYENVDNALHYYEGTDFFIGAVYVEDSGMFSGIDVGSYSNPAFADLDGDGDEDLTIGESGGSLEYYRNDGGGTWTYDASMYSGVSVSGYSTPTFADMDGDDDFDLTIGAGGGGDAGKFAYYRNDGTISSPSWVEDTGYYSGVDVGDYSNPALADMDNDGDIDLTSGESLGTVKYYRNDAGTWIEDTAPYSSIDVGDYSAPALADLDFNLCYDLTVGANNGLLYYYENKGTAASYDKLIWTNSPTSFSAIQMSNYYKETVTLKHRGDTTYEDTYADLINTAPTLWMDEIAFTIAHTATDILKNDNGDGQDVYPEVFKENVQYVYDIDPHLDYVDIVEKTATDGNYSTLAYWVNDTIEGLIQIELPRYYYYWYVVHPKIQDELPSYVDPDEYSSFDSQTEAPPVGKFWRPFYFYHNDAGYPLLKDCLAGIGTLWNCTQNNKIENGAIGVITQWIQDVWDFTDDGERPHEPVRLYRKHIGRCGEHADIAAAAARTALIPCFNVGAHASDHIWNEFWERGWHQWEPVNTYIDHPNSYHYHWDGGYGRDLAQVKGPRGDLLLINRTAYYHHGGDYGNLTIWVKDANGNPVDGAKVAIAAWRVVYIFWQEYGESWNYTDANGKCVLQIGECRQYSVNNDDIYNDGLEVHISSKYGGGTMNNGYSSRYIILGGENEERTYTLSGALPRPYPKATEVLPPAAGDYRMEVSYEVEYGSQYPPQAESDDNGMLNYHPHEKVTANHVDSFMISSTNLTEYLKGYQFGCHNLSKNSSSDNIVFEIPTADNWYYILSNQDTVETTKVVNITVNLYEIGGDISVDAPTNINAVLEGPSLEDVNITWTLSKDDGGGENDVVGYDIYYNQTYTNEDFNKSKTYTKIGYVGAGVSYFEHENDGLNTTDSFYYVVVKDGSGNTDATVDQAGKIVKECVLGWNFISDPYLGLDGTDIITVLQTLEWDMAKWYDPLNAEDHWKYYTSFRPSGFNDFTEMNRTMGIWVNVTIGGDHFVDTGRVHKSTAIQLRMH
jgi:hypothetical protein